MMEDALDAGIIADDLTSAADGGAPFARAGHKVFVGFGDQGASGGHCASVVALDLDSRARSGPEAAVLASEGARRLRNAPLLLKTMDSTLRGHVGFEVAAALSASGRRVALVAPAFPAAGRTTLGGVQHVDGEPVHRTAVARDLRHPVRVSRVAHLFGGTGSGPVVELGSSEARDPSRVRQVLATAQVVVADARTDADLDALVAAVHGSTGVLWVGSPGVAQALARACTAKRAVLWANLPEARRPLILVGSLHPASRAQVRTIEAVLGVQAVEIDPARAASDASAAEIARACAACRDIARSGSALVVRSAPLTVQDAAGAVASGLAEVARRVVGEGLADGMIATGGDTALAVARALGAEGLRLWGELEPGVPLGVLAGPHPLPVVTKAGGFGDPGTLLRLYAALEGMPLPTRDERQPA